MPRSPRSPLRYALAIALALLGLAAFAPAAFGNAELRVTTLEDRVEGSCAPYAEPADGCSLREAIELAAEGEGDGVSGEVTIAIAVNGTIKTGENGTLQVEAGTGVTALKISGPGKANLTIDAEKEERAFEASGGNVTISGLTIANGFEDDFAPDGDGGGALLQNAGNVTLENVLLTENATESGRNGGSIDVEGGNLTIVGATIEKSSVESDAFEASGGAIDIDSSGSTVTIRETAITSSSAGEGNGGAIFQDEGNLVVEDSVISGNKAEVAGGGIAAEPDGAHTTVIEGTTISGNSVKEDRAGGLLADTGSGGLILTESTISGNKAPEGGGVAVEGPTTVVSSTISGNEATTTGATAGFAGGGILADSHTLLLDTSTLAGNVGGALFANSAEVSIRASTIAANSNPSAGVGGIGGREEEAPFTVRSSIVAGNTGSGGGSADCSAWVTSEGHNIVGNLDPGCDWPEGEGDQLGATLQLGALADNGGPTATMAPTEAGNAAINHGGTPKPLDQRNLTRPVPVGPAFTDVGAVEVQAPVNTVAPVAEAPEGMLEGESIVCRPGSWDNDTITSGVIYSYAWFADNSPIGSESTYTLKAADANKDIACRVTANNGVTTSTEVESNALKMDPGALSLTPGSHDFGNRKVGSGPSAATEFTLENTGGTAVTVSGATNTDDQFEADASACTAAPLGPGDECTVKATFAPTAPGAQSSTMGVQSGVPTVTADLSGTGTAGALAITPVSFDFGSRAVGSGPSPAKTFEVSSTGNEAVTITTPSASGDFAVVATGDECAGETLLPDQGCTIEVVFDPSGTGERTGTLTLPSDVPSASAALSGTGLADAAFSADPSELGFGSHEVGSGTSVQTVTVANGGGVAAGIDSVAVSGADAEQFSLIAGGDECDGAELAPSATCTIEVGFTPSAAGAQSASLEIAGDAPTLLVPLNGTGVAKPAPPPPPVPMPRVELIGAGPFAGNASGKLPLTLACASPTGTPCEATVTLSSGGTALGSWNGALAAGGSEVAEVPLSPAGRKQLGAAGSIAAEAVIAYPDGTGSTFPVRLTAPPAPKLKLKSARRAGNAIVFKLSCQGYAARCRGQLALSAIKGGTKLAAGKVSMAKGAHQVRLSLSGAGKRLLEAEPRARLEVMSTAKDPVYQRTATATRQLRLSGS